MQSTSTLWVRGRSILPGIVPGLVAYPRTRRAEGDSGSRVTEANPWLLLTQSDQAAIAGFPFPTAGGQAAAVLQSTLELGCAPAGVNETRRVPTQ